MEPYLGLSWLDTPWLYSEFYAYRRVMEAFSFFKTGKMRKGKSKHFTRILNLNQARVCCFWFHKAFSAYSPYSYDLNERASCVSCCLSIFFGTAYLPQRTKVRLYVLFDDVVFFIMIYYFLL